MFLFWGNTLVDRLNPVMVDLLDSEMILRRVESSKTADLLLVEVEQLLPCTAWLQVLACKHAVQVPSRISLTRDLPSVGIQFEPHALLPGHVIRLVAHLPSLLII